jgi:uncharacterized protein YqgC (DUF456 family)
MADTHHSAIPPFLNSAIDYISPSRPLSMPHSLLLALLILCFLAGLVLLPFGLPGLWVMVLALIGYGAVTDFRSVGVATMSVAVGLALLGEVVEAWVGFRYASKYGGSRRAGWGALVGGLVGAIIGVPVPIIGSVIGSFAGAFLGAAVLEYTRSTRTGGALGAGWGAILGRTWAMAAKAALGMVIATLGVVAALRG